jgi:excisionase family DNA binding protein
MGAGKLLTVPEAAERLSVTPKRVYDLIESGTIQAVRIGRQIRLSPIWLDEFIASGGKPLAGGWKRDNASAAA